MQICTCVSTYLCTGMHLLDVSERIRTARRPRRRREMAACGVPVLVIFGESACTRGSLFQMSRTLQLFFSHTEVSLVCAVSSERGTWKSICAVVAVLELLVVSQKLKGCMRTASAVCLVSFAGEESTGSVGLIRWDEGGGLTFPGRTAPDACHLQAEVLAAGHCSTTSETPSSAGTYKDRQRPSSRLHLVDE